jgi:tetratricopeptide (TPR) repeat protein
VRERREQAADLVVVALQQALAAAERRLGESVGDTSQDAVVVVFDGDRVRARPELLYYPVVPTNRSGPAHVFAGGEKLEVQQQDYLRAIAVFRELAKSPDVAIQAGAQLRIARNLRKAGQPEQALDEYRALARFGPVRLEGGPADLVAGRARVALLAQLNRTGESRQEAEALAKDLGLGRWELGRATFLHYAQAVGYEPPPEAAVYAAAVEWLWNKRKLAPAARRRLLC